jgi:hypothetical protein
MAEKFDLNQATVGDLEKIPGITRALARRIIATRDKQGGFVTLAALRDISGVTDDLLAVLKEHVTVDAAAAQEKTQVVRVNLDPQGEHAGSYGGYKVTAELVALTVLPGTEEQVAVPRAITTDASADGLATLTLPDLAAIQGPISFIVRAPDGQILARADRAKSDLRETLPLPVAPRGLPTTQPADDPAFNQPAKLRGRVIDREGRVQIAGKQVVIWTATVANPQDADFAAVMVAETDATGYFSGAYPLGQFTAAHATVALDPAQAVPIRLNADRTMPADVILVVDAPRRIIDQHGEDCICPAETTPRNPDAGDLVNGVFSSDIGQGRCVDFTRPDRTLQEFSYSYVVRTTEPSIKGLTLAEPRRIPPAVLGEIIKLSNLSVLASTTTRALSADTNDDNQAIALRSAKITNAAAAVENLELHADVWRKSVSNPDKVSDKSILDVAKTSKYLDIVRAIDKSLVVAPDRTRLSCRNPVDWDDDPTIYQACTVAHGHILHFKQEWIADGYSMGRLLYSLPLAPGQKKQIAVLDWERRETAIRQEALEETESLQATLSRDRDIGEMVSSVLSESSRGGSSASTSAVAGGIGIGAILGPVGGLLGIGGGASNANSRAWQDSSRQISADSLQTLRDRTSQSAASMRAQRSTVIQTVTQGERVSVTTESVANYNHCHAMTMEYFEVLRHLIVRQRIVDVQECLFVPLQMSRFDRPKALRWRHTLRNIVPDRALRAGFDALERIDNNYEGSDMPTGAYADEKLDFVEGELTIRFQLARPRDKDDDFDSTQWQWMGILLPMTNAEEAYRNFLKDQKLKDRIFLEQLGPRIARAFVDLMKVSWVDSNDVEHPLPIDTTLLSNFTNDTQLAVSLRLSGAVPPVARKDIKFIKISEFAFPGINFFDVLPANSRVIVDGGHMSYRTKFSSGYLFRSGRIANDLTGSDAVRIFTPLTLQELRKPREEDKELARRLLDHLNENIERYHHALWWRMSPDRRYMLLDGFEAPNSEGRSVASVVDNTLIGIVGNSLVMPVSRGFHLDPMFDQDVERPIDLLEHYQPNTPIEPVRVAIPTRGVYAEAVMGACNSCETKEEERFWRWEESPIPDNPTAILPVSTESRQTPAPDLTAKDFPAPIIAMQNAPAAPDPTGLAGALTLLGQSGLFKDITGLEGNQRNALEALKSSLQTAQFFGEKAGNLALQARMNKDIDKSMRAIESAKQQGLLSDEQASQLTQGAIQSMIGAGPSTEPKAMATEDVKQVTETAGANNAAVKVSRPSGEQVEVDARPQTLPDGTVARKATITLSADTASAETRAFNPATNSLTGEVSLEVQVNDAPSGFTLRWTPAEAAALEVVTPDAQKTIVRGKRPGRTRLDVAVFNGGNQIAKTQLLLCVPQFVAIDEDAAKFTAVLAQLKLDTRKGDVLTEARDVCRELLKTANVRTVWRMAPFTEAVPAHVGAALVTTVRIEGEPPNDPVTGQPQPLFGGTGSGGTGIGPTSFNERIVLFPGAYDVPQPASPTTQATMVDATTQAILLDVQATAAPPATLIDLAIKVFGRLIGETMAHEITHSLLGASVGKLGADGHNAPPVAGELMNDWLNRNFRQRTGIEDTALTSPIDPNNFTDHGIPTIGKLGLDNQGLINARFPVPPNFA